MKILFLGDVVGRSGREAVARYLPQLRADHAPDLVIINGENAAHGFGLTAKVAAEFHALGAQVVTTGNHVWDQKEFLGQIDAMPLVLRPLNFPAGTPGRGSAIVTLASGAKVLVVNLMGRLFMDPLDDPFAAVQTLLAQHKLGQSVQAIFVDMHAEASSEKMAMAHYLDGRVSAVVGTHTHVPTADAQILPHGTAYQTDAGMCGDYDSVIGMKKDVPVARFVRKLPTDRLSPAEGEGTVCGVLVTVDPRNGRAQAIVPVRRGARLAQQN